MSFPRPVPTIGDPTSAHQRASDHAAWRLTEVIGPLAEAVAARRDIRRYRPDPVPSDVLTAVLTAGHQAPSVGHCQPWRFIIVDDSALRDAAAAMSDRARLRQAALLDDDASRALRDLQLEGIREAPLGIVVACDRRAPAAGVLGRATFTDADLWSCATAIQNMWLTARAHGLGMGWVTLFEPVELAALLHLPDGVETLGWLCLGWPDERPPEPGLQRAGWSKRQPLESVLMRNGWADAATPVSRLATAPAQADVVGARDTGDTLLTVPGSLGALDTAVDRLLALDTALSQPTLVVAAAAHGVCRHHVSAFDPKVAHDIWQATVDGTSMGAVAAGQADMDLRAVDAGLNLNRDVTTEDGLPRDHFTRLLADGTALGATLPGPVALGEIGIGNTTIAAICAAVLTGCSPADVVGRGSGADTAMMARKHQAVVRALARIGTTTDSLEVIRRGGGAELAFLTGVIIGTARRGSAVICDGMATTVCALAAVRAEPAIQSHLIAGHRSRELGHGKLLAELGCEPVLDQRIRAGEGVGAALAWGVLSDALAIRYTVARTSEQ